MAEQIGRYEIRRELGQGGMATVYLAYDPGIQRQVAIKVLPRQFTHDPRYLDRFQQEAHMIAALEHPAIVPIYDFGEHNDAPYLVMRYMAGGSLRSRLSGEPLSLEDIAAALDRLAPALDHAHEVGIIHRDLKPSNILFDHQGNSYLADFGIARMAEASQTMTIVGTPAYMSPEQVESEVQLDGRSDIYAIGVILYELLTGKQPYIVETPTGQMLMHITKPVPNILEANPDLPPQTQQLIEKAMAKDREDRYQSAEELASAVNGLLAGEAATAMKSAGAKTEPNVAESPGEMEPQGDAALEDGAGLPGWIWWVGALALLLIAGLGIRAILGGGSDPEPTPTPTAEPAPLIPELGDTWERPADGMTMVYVPEGSFAMGSEENDDEKPAHEVRLDAFWIDRTEVTNAQYALCVSDGKCERSKYADDSDYNGDDYPVVGVSWNDAEAYCSWADARLPTEAEWEYAARGPEGNKYPWGNEAPDCDLAQFNECDGRTIPAGSLAAGKSWAGALDMSGNVWEWLNDWYDVDYYANSPRSNPQGPDSGTVKVLRGGSWDLSEILLRSAIRDPVFPGGRYDNVGFRCVVAPGE